MFLLILGVALWAGAHLAKRLVPGFHRALQGAERPMVTGLVVTGLVLMVLGYRMAEGAFFWGRTPATVGVMNLAMLVSVYFFAAAGMKTALARRLRHPMLLAVLIWAGAHLLVNGDVPSFVLFGGMGLWALAEIVLINRSKARWTPPAPAGARKELMAVVGTLVVYGAIAGAHYALGYPAFG